MTVLIAKVYKEMCVMTSTDKVIEVDVNQCKVLQIDVSADNKKSECVHTHTHTCDLKTGKVQIVIKTWR